MSDKFSCDNTTIPGGKCEHGSRKFHFPDSEREKYSTMKHEDVIKDFAEKIGNEACVEGDCGENQNLVKAQFYIAGTNAHVNIPYREYVTSDGRSYTIVSDSFCDSEGSYTILSGPRESVADTISDMEVLHSDGYSGVSYVNYQHGIHETNCRRADIGVLDIEWKLEAYPDDFYFG